MRVIAKLRSRLPLSASGVELTSSDTWLDPEFGMSPAKSGLTTSSSSVSFGEK